ncbi:hypothetical protein RWE87_13200 [Sinorhizobium meliloti]|uniref:hypothetical protein n=1 Tax=Rhizobium meliloti TaxID=382 RepID=UPI00299F4393|nr:hypothetical protein [Sinorhizobium meliloti]
MKRREVFLSGVALALCSARSAGAQAADPILPSQRQVAAFLADEGSFQAVILGVEALRLNLILGAYQDPSEEVQVYASSSVSFDDMKAKAFDGFQRLRGSLDRNSDEKMKALEPALQKSVQLSVEVLSKFGIPSESELMRKQSTAYWTFLYTLTESGVVAPQGLKDWLCGSSPFKLLCS